ncbi:unnamed protein product [Prunus armeniaca]
MKNINNTKLILLHPYIQKQGTSNHLWLLAFMSIFTLAFLLTIIYTSGLYAYSSTTTTAISAATITTTTTASTLMYGFYYFLLASLDNFVIGCVLLFIKLKFRLRKTFLGALL